jgi:hypothetical protein
MKQLEIIIILISCLVGFGYGQQERQTHVTIEGQGFLINGKPSYEGRFWEGHKVEGLLLNSRMVQGIFDDLNKETVSQWVYPDTQKWDPDRNTAEFINNMALWKSHGMLSFTLNLQGGSPYGYSQAQPWYNSAFDSLGGLRKDYFERLDKILEEADRLGMVPIIGLFYFGQDERLSDEKAVIAAVRNTVNWLFDKGYQNVLIEINNECDIRYDHEILQPARVHELIDLVKKMERNGKRFPVSTSYSGSKIPMENVVSRADFILLHGNGVSDPKRIEEMVEQVKKVKGYRPMPILFNEDDHFDFDQEQNNFKTSIAAYASWGFFDFRMEGEGFESGFQSVPVDWGINSERKKGFFNTVREITGN